MYQHSNCVEKTQKIPGDGIPENDSGLRPKDDKKRKQVLIVDDERPIRMLLQKILEANGYACGKCRSGAGSDDGTYQ